MTQGDARKVSPCETRPVVPKVGPVKSVMKSRKEIRLVENFLYRSKTLGCSKKNLIFEKLINRCSKKFNSNRTIPRRADGSGVLACGGDEPK